MTPLVLVKGKYFILSPQMFEPERSQVEAEKLVKGLEFKQQNMCASKTNMSWKQRLVHLLRSISECDDGNGDPVPQRTQ